MENYYKPTPETVKTVASAAKALESARQSVQESAPTRYGEIWPLYSKLRFADSSQWIKRLAAKVWHEFYRRRRRKFDGPMLTVSELSEIVEKRDTLKREYLAWFQNYDVLICPTNSSPARLIGEDARPKLVHDDLQSDWLAFRGGAMWHGGRPPIGLRGGATVPRRRGLRGGGTLESVLGGWKPPAI